MTAVKGVASPSRPISAATCQSDGPPLRPAEPPHSSLSALVLSAAAGPTQNQCILTAALETDRIGLFRPASPEQLFQEVQHSALQHKGRALQGRADRDAGCERRRLWHISRRSVTAETSFQPSVGLRLTAHARQSSTGTGQSHVMAVSVLLMHQGDAVGPPWT